MTDNLMDLAKYVDKIQIHLLKIYEEFTTDFGLISPEFPENLRRSKNILKILMNFQ